MRGAGRVKATEYFGEHASSSTSTQQTEAATQPDVVESAPAPAPAAAHSEWFGNTTRGRGRGRGRGGNSRGGFTRAEIESGSHTASTEVTFFVFLYSLPNHRQQVVTPATRPAPVTQLAPAGL